MWLGRNAINKLELALDDVIKSIELNDFFEVKDRLNEYSIVCWFGDDEFCQINLLTLLAFLKQINYKKSIILHVIDEETYIIKETKNIDVSGYKKQYLNYIKHK